MDQQLNIAQNAWNWPLPYSFLSKISSKSYSEMFIIMKICLIYNLSEVIHCICFTETGITVNISRRHLFYINSYSYALCILNCLMLRNRVIIKRSLNVCQTGTFYNLEIESKPCDFLSCFLLLFWLLFLLPCFGGSPTCIPKFM